MSRAGVLAAYRRLLRAADTVFGRDVEALSAARLKARAEYVKNKDTGGENIQKLVKISDDAATYLTKAIAQAELVEGNTYRLRIRNDHLRDNPLPKKI